MEIDEHLKMSFKLFTDGLDVHYIIYDNVTHENKILKMHLKR